MWQKIKYIFSYENRKEDEPWQISAARFCRDKQAGFTQQQLFDYLEQLSVSKHQQRQFFTFSISNPLGSQHARDHEGGIWSAPLELVSMVIDYDELKEARRNALSAWRWAIASFIVATIAGIAQVVQLGF